MSCLVFLQSTKEQSLHHSGSSLKLQLPAMLTRFRAFNLTLPLLMTLSKKPKGLQSARLAPARERKLKHLQVQPQTPQLNLWRAPQQVTANTNQCTLCCRQYRCLSNVTNSPCSLSCLHCYAVLMLSNPCTLDARNAPQACVPDQAPNRSWCAPQSCQSQHQPVGLTSGAGIQNLDIHSASATQESAQSPAQPSSRPTSGRGQGPGQGGVQSHPQQRRPLQEYQLEPNLQAACNTLAAAEQAKPKLHLVVLGHVDAGKSTLMGRLLHDLG